RRRGRTWLKRTGLFAEQDAVYAHRPRDILDPLLAQILEREGELVAHLIADNAADTDPAGFGQTLKPCSDVDAVAKDVAPVLDYVAEIDPHAQFDTAIRSHIGVPLGHGALHFDRAAHRVDDAGELDQQPVAGGLDDTAPVLLDLGIAQLTPDRL